MKKVKIINLAYGDINLKREDGTYEKIKSSATAYVSGNDMKDKAFGGYAARISVQKVEVTLGNNRSTPFPPFKPGVIYVVDNNVAEFLQRPDVVRYSGTLTADDGTKYHILNVERRKK